MRATDERDPVQNIHDHVDDIKRLMDQGFTISQAVRLHINLAAKGKADVITFGIYDISSANEIRSGIVHPQIVN